jgi:hypothetical protein
VSDAPVEEEAPPVVGDVDVADVDPGKGKGELGPVILPGYWVKISPDADLDEEFDSQRGALATVVESPWSNVPFAGDSEETLHGYRYDKDKKYLVRTRGAAEVNVDGLTEEDFADFGDGRSGLLGHA